MFFAALSLAGQAVSAPQANNPPLSPSAIVLSSKSQVSLSDAYTSACAHGNLLIITPDYNSSAPMPVNCEQKPAVLDLRRPDSLTGRLNVRNEGATGDGQTDDTAALQQAIDFSLKHPVGRGPQGSPVIYLPAGTYKISQTLRIPAQLHIIGDGPETSTLLLTNPKANLITVYRGTCTDWACDGSLEGMTLEGGGSQTTGTLLEIASADSFHIRDVKMYNNGGRGLQINAGSERFNSNNLYMYNVRWPIILAGDINESYFWNTQIIDPGATNQGKGRPEYCYSVNCVNGVYPGPNSGPNGSPTPINPDTHAAIFVDKSVNFSFYGGSIKPLKYLAGIQILNGDVSTIQNFYFEGYPYDKTGRFNAAVIAGGASEHTTLTASLARDAKEVPVESTEWVTQFFNDPADIPRNGGNYYPYVILPQDYLSGSTEASHYVPGVKRGQYEIVNAAGFSGEGKLYITTRNVPGSLVSTNTSWPAGSIIEEQPMGSYGAINLENSHINAIQPPGQGYKDNCDQTNVRTCADIIVGNIPDGLYVDPIGAPNATPGHRPYGASLNIRSVTIPNGNFAHKGEIATHRFASVTFDGGNIPNRPENGEVLDPKNLRMDISELTGGGYLTVPMYNTGKTAQPQVTFSAIDGVYYPATGLFTRYETQFGQGGYPQGGWMNGLKFANQYCWFDTPPAGEKQSTNRICINGGPSNTVHPGYEYDVWSGSKWVNAFLVQGKPDNTADVSISGNLSVAKTLYVKSIQVANGANGLGAMSSNAEQPSVVSNGTTGAIGGSMLTAGQCATGQARVAGAKSGMVATTSPESDPGDGFIWQAYISSANAVTVKVCALSRGTPRPVTYSVRVQ